jgi:phage-related protein
MDRRALLLTLGAATAAVVSAPARRALACACCSDEGVRVDEARALDGWYLSELMRIQLGRTARLFTGAADVADAAKGIRDASDTYAMAVTRTTDKRGNVWTLAFVDARGKTGNLSWVLPKMIEELAVDTRDPKAQTGNGPLLYKELRLRMPVAGTGVFEPGNAVGTTARLVLQGRGNMCVAAEDFTHWSLAVGGPRARYQFFGTLAAPGAGK